MKLNARYIPRHLSRKDRRRQVKHLVSLKRKYKRGIYAPRPKLKSFRSRPSQHVRRAKRIYNVDKITATNELAKATGCTKQALRKIIKKGEGAYYSSGSRPNQTAQSWGYARLASAITAGKSAAVDFDILKRGCSKTSKALKLAKQAVKKHGHGTRRARKTIVI